MKDANVNVQTPTLTQVSDDLRNHLVELSGQDLQNADLQELQDFAHGAAEAGKTLASIVKRVNAELERRYGDQIKALLNAKPDPYGIATITLDNGYKVKAELGKKVEWSQSALATKFEELVARGMNAADYIDVDYSLPEKRYGALPKEIQDYFADARTVTPGSLKFTIENNNGK
jgi:hypothetical protein